MKIASTIDNNPSAAIFMMNQSLFKDNNIAYIDSRFGKIRIDSEKAIYLPSGMLGMPDKTGFCLASFPDPKFSQFNILQSIDDPELAFIVLPLDDNGSLPTFQFIEKKDLEAACHTLQIQREHLAILLITSIHRSLDAREVRISVNVRAPLLIDTQKATATQFVFQNNKYQVRHVINEFLS